MSETILLIFEGERTEAQIFKNLKKEFFGDETNNIRFTVYHTDIYQLWKNLDDEYLDLLEVLKEIFPANQETIGDIEREDVSQIFLFFDYDGHATNASDDKIEEMLAHFDEETENGKLYLSYPMVEALKDINSTDSFKDNCVPAKHNINYKEQVGLSSDYQDIRKISRENWDHIIRLNLRKANFIVTDSHTYPREIITQDSIFDGQLEKFIKPKDEVAVLSSFPFFVAEYFGLQLFELSAT